MAEVQFAVSLGSTDTDDVTAYHETQALHLEIYARPNPPEASR